MNQPPNPVPPRGARPQLFNAPAAASAHAKRHADFGPSILATIDGGQSRIAHSRDRLPVKRVLLLGALALVVAAAYVGVKFSGARAVPAAPQVLAMSAPPPAVPVALKVAELEASAPVAVVAQGAAAIETVAPVAAPPVTQATSSPASVATSLNNIQLALDHSEPPSAKKEKAASADVVKLRGAAPVAPAVGHVPTKSAPAPDTDADLLAAMLPHLKRSVAAPTSPAYDKRCGQLTGEAAVDCRAKFCNGRQGVDAACPAPPAQR